MKSVIKVISAKRGRRSTIRHAKEIRKVESASRERDSSH